MLRPFSRATLRLLLFLLWPWAAVAQEHPPPGGWPLRTVTELRTVPEPPGGLVPYRQGKLWGFADTTGRVWIRPVFDSEPPRFGAGLLLMSEQREPNEYRPAQKSRQIWPNGLHGQWSRYREPRPHGPGTSQAAPFSVSNNLRFGHWLYTADGSLAWAMWCQKHAKAGLTWLLNAQGEQMVIHPKEAIGQTAGGGWRAVARRGRLRGQLELVAIAPHELESETGQPGRLFTVPLGSKSPVPSSRLTRKRAYAPDMDFTDSYAGTAPLYLARKVNWLRPTRQVIRNGRCGDRFEDTDTRYRYHGQFALFDARGRRLTKYAYGGMKRLLPQRLAYWHWADSVYEDERAAEASGVALRWTIVENTNGPARRYGLLDRQGREITPPVYARMEAAGPNSLWVVAVRQGRLQYGLIDTLGQYLLPLSYRPLSPPDADGWLRRSGAVPFAAVENPRTYRTETLYPDTTTTQYLRADGRVAFAGRFLQAGPFWRGRAVAQVGAGYGLLDSAGRWVLPPQPEELLHYAFSAQHAQNDRRMDPLELFGSLADAQTGGPYRSTLANYPQSLLLTYGPAGYGFRDGRTGRVLVPALFDEAPRQWPGGAVGQRNKKPLGYSYSGQTFDPEVPASYPPGVKRPKPETMDRNPLLQRIEQGWLSRSGRRFWQD